MTRPNRPGNDIDFDGPDWRDTFQRAVFWIFVPLGVLIYLGLMVGLIVGAVMK